MIAPTACSCKGAVAHRFHFRAGSGPCTRRCKRHAIVSAIIMPPNFCQATALLNCEKKTVRWPGPFGSGFLSPQPPGVVGIGPVPQPNNQRSILGLVLFVFGRFSFGPS